MNSPTEVPVGLYIPVFNGAKYLAQTLAAVRAQTVRPRQVVVFDDGSTDDSPIIARDLGFRVISNPINSGIAVARNAAVRTLTTEYVACLDSDAVPAPDWLERMFVAIKPDRIGGVCGRVVEGVTTTCADRWRAARLNLAYGDSRLEAVDLFTNNALYRREALLDAGGYNEDLIFSFEDVDLSNRLRLRGWQSVYEPRASAVHRKCDTVKSVLQTHAQWTFPLFPAELAKERVDWINDRGARHGFERYARRALDTWTKCGEQLTIAVGRGLHHVPLHQETKRPEFVLFECLAVVRAALFCMQLADRYAVIAETTPARRGLFIIFLQVFGKEFPGTDFRTVYAQSIKDLLPEPVGQGELGSLAEDEGALLKFVGDKISTDLSNYLASAVSGASLLARAITLTREERQIAVSRLVREAD